MKPGQSRANANRAIRQQALRDQLEAQGHEQHIAEKLELLADLPAGDKNFRNKLDKIKVALEYHFKLMGKYIPDLKATEHTFNPEEDSRVVGFKFEVVKAEKEDRPH